MNCVFVQLRCEPGKTYEVADAIYDREIVSELYSTSGDYDLLILAIHNLLDNAIKFTHPGDTVEMRAFEDDANVVIEVADTGPGIPEGEISHVWEELYRGEGARGVPGSGLGLALSRAIVLRPFQPHKLLLPVLTRILFPLPCIPLFNHFD